MKPHTQAIKRALEATGFVFLRGGWVRREAAPRLQDKIDRAVKDAAEAVERIKGDGRSPVSRQWDARRDGAHGGEG